MHIHKIKINNFKNYISSEVSFSERINFLYGKNGAGKTNLMDAIHFISFGKSAINKFDIDNVNHKKTFFTLEGYYSNNCIYINAHMRSLIQKKFMKTIQNTIKSKITLVKFPLYFLIHMTLI